MVHTSSVNHHGHNTAYVQDKSNVQAWVVCLVAALFFFYEFIQMNMFSSLDDKLIHAFAIDATQLGKLAAVYFIANVIFLFPAGMLLDRFSTKKIILTSLSICFVGTFLFSTTHVFMLALVFRFFTGIGSAFCFLCCVRLASRWFPASMMALITGVIITIAMLGGMVAQTPLTLLIQHFGWRHALMIDAGLGFVIFCCIFLFVKDYPVGYQIEVEKQHAQLQNLGIFKSIRQSIFRIQNWLAGAYTCFMNLPIYLLGALWGSLYLTQVDHLSVTRASYVTSMIFLGTIIGSPLVGRISDKMGLRRKPMFWGCILSLVIISPLVFDWHLSLSALMLLFFLLGLTTSTQVLSYPMVAENNPLSLTATSVSVVSTSVISGGMIFQPVFGWIMDESWQGVMHHHVRIYSEHAFHNAMLIMPIAFILAFAAVYFLHETHCRSASE